MSSVTTGERIMHARAVYVFIVAAALALAGCGKKEEATQAQQPAPLTDKASYLPFFRL